jgi:hypothetical protein
MTAFLLAIIASLVDPMPELALLLQAAGVGTLIGSVVAQPSTRGHELCTAAGAHRVGGEAVEIVTVLGREASDSRSGGPVPRAGA